MKPKRIAIVSIETVLPLIQRPHRNSATRALIGEYWVGVSSTALRTFQRKGTVCVACGLAAQFFAIERYEDGNYGLALYSRAHGKEVLFTHDHILARAFGGTNEMHNLQVMCSPCNNYKAAVEYLVHRIITDPNYVHVDKRVRRSLQEARKNERRRASQET